MTTVDWLIWIFFGLPALAIWKCDNVMDTIHVVGLMLLLPYIEYWRMEIMRICSND